MTEVPCRAYVRLGSKSCRRPCSHTLRTVADLSSSTTTFSTTARTPTHTPRRRAFARIAESRSIPGKKACEEEDTYHQFDPLGRAIVGRQCVALAFATGVHGRGNRYASVWNQPAIVIKTSRAVCDRVLDVKELLSQSVNRLVNHDFVR